MEIIQEGGVYVTKDGRTSVDTLGKSLSLILEKEGEYDVFLENQDLKYGTSLKISVIVNGRAGVIFMANGELFREVERRNINFSFIISPSDLPSVLSIAAESITILGNYSSYSSILGTCYMHYKVSKVEDEGFEKNVIIKKASPRNSDEFILNEEEKKQKVEKEESTIIPITNSLLSSPYMSSNPLTSFSLTSLSPFSLYKGLGGILSNEKEEEAREVKLINIEEKGGQGILDNFGIRKRNISELEKEKICELEFDGVIDPSLFHISIGRFGGPIAVLTKFGDQNSPPSKFPMLSFYNGGGERTSGMIAWYPSMTTIDMKWLENESLLVLLRDGRILVYNMFGDAPSMERIAAESDFFQRKENLVIILSYIQENGTITFLTDNQELYQYKYQINKSSHGESTLLLFASNFPLLDILNSCMVIIPSDSLGNESNKIIITSTRGGKGTSVFIIEEDKVEVIENLLSDCYIVRLSIHPFCHLISCFTSNGCLLIYSIDFKELYLKLRLWDEKSFLVSNVLDMCWLGEYENETSGMETVFVSCKSPPWDVGSPYGIIAVRRDGTWESFPSRFFPFMVSEVDTLRIYEIPSMEIEVIDDSAGNIPPCSYWIICEKSHLRLSDSANILISAFQMFNENNPESRKTLDSLDEENRLKEALDDCFNHLHNMQCTESNRSLQEKITGAISFALSYSKKEKDLEQEGLFDAYNKYANDLKIINQSIRTLSSAQIYPLCMCLTFKQYKLLTLTSLIGRITQRRQYTLAINIALYNQHPIEGILQYWACRLIKLSVNLPENVIVEKIKSQFRKYKLSSFAMLAACAKSVSKLQLAIKLACLQDSVSCITTLLFLRQYELALDQAVSLQNIDNIYLVIIKSKEFYYDFNEEKLFDLINRHSISSSLFVSYYKVMDKRMLHRYMKYSKKFKEAGLILARESYNTPLNVDSESDLVRVQQHLEQAINMFETSDGAREYSAIDEEILNFYIEATAMQRKLLGIQLKISLKTIGLSLNETIINCYSRRHIESDTIASSIATSFNISGRNTLHLKLISLASIGEWKKIREISEELNPPISIALSTFVDLALANNNIMEAKIYIFRIDDENIRLQYFIVIREWTYMLLYGGKYEDFFALNLVERYCNEESSRNRAKLILEEIEKKIVIKTKGNFQTIRNNLSNSPPTHFLSEFNDFTTKVKEGFKI